MKNKLDVINNTYPLRLRPFKAPEITRETRVVDAFNKVAFGEAIGVTDIKLIDNRPAEWLDEKSKERIMERNKIGKNAEDYVIGHEEHHIRNALARPNLSDLNFAYRYILAFHDESSALMKNYFKFLENPTDARNEYVVALNKPYNPHNSGFFEKTLEFEILDMYLSAQIRITEYAKRYFQQFREDITKSKNDAVTELNFQHNLYERMLDYYYTFDFQGSVVKPLEVLRQNDSFNKKLQNDFIYVFAFPEVVANPKDDSIYGKFVEPRAQQWLYEIWNLKCKITMQRMLSGKSRGFCYE